MTLLIGVIIFNTIYLGAVADEMLELTSSLPGARQLSFDGFSPHSEKLTRLSEYWQKHALSVSMTVGYDTVSAISAALSAAEEYFAARSVADFAAARGALLLGIERLKEAASLNADNIF